MKKILKMPLMIILVPLDYIGWNLFFSGNDRRLTLRDSIKDCWRELMG